ncbi:MAG: FtsH protease activity modulator HflK [Chloroflexota bacterium]
MAFNGSPPPRRNDEYEQLEDTIRNFSGWFSNRGSGLYILILVVLLLLWLASGIYVVQAGEEGVIQTFGSFTSISQPGLNYHLPRPIQKRTIVNVEAIRRVEIGFRTTNSGRQTVLNEALMLTEDENIVQLELVVQYRIADSRNFVFNVQNPEDVLLSTAEVALRGTVGQMTIDDVITEERARVQNDTMSGLSTLLDEYGAGIQVTNVQLQEADPPEEVIDAFQEVVRALADKERLINESQAYQNDIVPRARGERQRAIEEATAFSEQRVLRATGDADRFLAILKAYQLAPEVTRERMHIEAVEDILNSVDLTLLDPNAVGSQVLPFLPLGDLNGSGGPTITNQSATEQGGN